MPLYESPAIIIRGIRLNESDRIITLFTRDYGKIKAVAKGCLKPKSRLMGRLEPFLHTRAIFFGKEKAELFYLNTSDIIETFTGMRDDYEKLMRAFAAAELVDVCQKEKDANRDGFNMLLVLLRKLSASAMPADKLDMLLRLFEFKYLSSIGFMPSMGACAVCGGAIAGPRCGFNPSRGAVCGSCLHKSGAQTINASPGAIKLLERSLSTPMERLERISSGTSLLNDVERMVRAMIDTHTRKRMKSERFLKL
ncbi:MAG: DNA repair protein RecO [Nitrospinae bacterium]|nr:DNA repair protein RecO [Nitrospinota bacterium]